MQTSLRLNALGLLVVLAAAGVFGCATKSGSGGGQERIASEERIADPAIRDLRIKISGCFNSCSHHHIADIGFYGISRNVGGYVVPHFQMVLGGQFQNNGDRKSTRLNSSHMSESRMPSSA